MSLIHGCVGGTSVLYWHMLLDNATVRCGELLYARERGMIAMDEPKKSQHWYCMQRLAQPILSINQKPNCSMERCTQYLQYCGRLYHGLPWEV